MMRPFSFCFQWFPGIGGRAELATGLQMGGKGFEVTMQRIENLGVVDEKNLERGDGIGESCRYNEGEGNVLMATASQAPLLQMERLFGVVSRSVQVFGSTEAAVE